MRALDQDAAAGARHPSAGLLPCPVPDRARKDAGVTVKIPITIACGDYDRTRAIKDGRVPVEGCAVTYIPLEPEEVFFRAFRYQEFDVCELSFSSYPARRPTAASPPYTRHPRLRVARVPPFRHLYPHRPRHPHAAGSEGQDHRSAGIPDHRRGMDARHPRRTNMASIPTDIHWRSGGIGQPGRDERTPLAPHSRPRLKPIRPTRRCRGCWRRASSMRCSAPARRPASPRAHPMSGASFSNYRAVEQDYYRKTKRFPIMHLIGVKKDLVERHPWLPTSLLQGVCRGQGAGAR